MMNIAMATICLILTAALSVLSVPWLSTHRASEETPVAGAHTRAGADDCGTSCALTPESVQTAPAGDSCALPQTSRCADYSACSLYGDLSLATDDILAMYEREQSEDGQRFTDFSLPAFEAYDLAGDPVRSMDLLGRSC